MLKISPLEKQAKKLKEKLPQKAQDKFDKLKNKTTTLSHELKVNAKVPPFLAEFVDSFLAQFEHIKKRSEELYYSQYQTFLNERISLHKFVYGAGIYNLVLAVCLGLPEGIVNIGVNIGDHALSELIAAFLLFTAVIQIVGSRDLRLFGWAIYWEGILRCICGLLLSLYGFFGHLGLVAGLLGLIDICIGAVYLIRLPEITRKSPRELLTGRSF